MTRGGPLSDLLASLVASAGGTGGRDVVTRLAVACGQRGGGGHAAIVVRRPGQAASMQGMSSSEAAAAVDVEQRNGEGPSWDAAESDRPVLVGDLGTEVRWVQSTPELASLGVRAVAALPLQVGAAAIGVLTLYLTEVPGWDERAATGLLELADAVTLVLLGLQGDREDGRLSVPLAGAVDRSASVHQATGMVSVQVDCDLDEALLRLRAHAFAHEQPLAQIAAAVVARTLRFQP